MWMIVKQDTSGVWHVVDSYASNDIAKRFIRVGDHLLYWSRFHSVFGQCQLVTIEERK